MSDERIIVPTKEAVQKLLAYEIENKIVGIQTIGELLGMKLVDSLLPKIKGEPAWGYEGLRAFCVDNGINAKDTLEEALRKLQ